MSRLFYYSFSALHFVLLFWAKITVFRLKQRSKGKGIAALPYYPADWPGGKDRFAEWEKYFSEQGVTYRVHDCWKSEDLLRFFEVEKNNKIRHKYQIYWKLYWKRYRLLKELKKYEAVWIQRAYVPMFPFRDAYYEKLIKKIHPNVVYDYYDADYVTNQTLVYNSVRSGKAVTVASLFLKTHLSQIQPNIKFVRYAINTDGFVPVNNNAETIKVGWMGSPANAKELLAISRQFQRIESEYPGVQFSFVCRDLPDLDLKNCQVQKWGDDGFDYYQWLSKLDIGIVPFIDQSDTTKAKISMKSLEFMCAEVAQICSPWVHSDVMKDEETFLLAQEEEWYEKLKLLIDNPDMRTTLAAQSKQAYQKHHSFESVYKTLSKVLLHGE